MLIILNQNNRQNLERLAIYGAGSAGQSLLDNIASLKKYKIYLFVDDDQNKVGMKISKYPIVSRHEFLKTYKLKKIKLLIIAIPSLSNYQKKLLLENLSDCNVQVKFLPSLDQILSNKYSIIDLRNIRFDDLFSKKNNFQNNLMMEKFYKEKTILLTGAGGSIGSVIFKKLILFNPKHIILVDKSELNLFNITKYFADSNLNIKITTCLYDLLNSNKLKNIFKIYSIDHVIHAAAYKHVSIVENNKGYALYNNLISTFNLVEESLISEVKSVTLISSDKSVNPSTFMGMTKLVCEIFFKYMGSKHTELKKKLNIVRFGNVFHSSGSVVEIFKKQIENQGPITISDKKATRFFMSIDNACELVLSSLVINNSNNLTNTYVLDMGKPINILDLAKKISKFYGKELVEKKTNYNNPNEIEYIITGLTKGEKIEEELSYSKLYKSELKDILIDSFEIKNFEKIENFFDELSKYIRNYEINDAENLVIKLSKNIDEYIIYKK